MTVTLLYFYCIIENVIVNVNIWELTIFGFRFVEGGNGRRKFRPGSEEPYTVEDDVTIDTSFERGV